eukprot:SAG31_NODE_287_length_18430_cov_8.127544_22_plen_276_part_00
MDALHSVLCARQVGQVALFYWVGQEALSRGCVSASVPMLAGEVGRRIEPVIGSFAEHFNAITASAAGTGSRWVYFGVDAADAKKGAGFVSLAETPGGPDVVLTGETTATMAGAAAPCWVASLRRRLEFFLAAPRNGPAVPSLTLNGLEVEMQSAEQLLEMLEPLPSFPDPHGFLDDDGGHGVEVGKHPAYGNQAPQVTDAAENYTNAGGQWGSIGFDPAEGQFPAIVAEDAAEGPRDTELLKGYPTFLYWAASGNEHMSLLAIMLACAPKHDINL